MRNPFKKRPAKGPDRVNMNFLSWLISKWFGRKMGFALFVFEVDKEFYTVDFFHNTNDSREVAALVWETIEAQRTKPEEANAS